MQASEAALSAVTFNQGEALLRIASTYPTIFEIIMEQVQNALDVNATRISITFNRKSRHIAVRDNGDGVSKSEFEHALGSVCSSVKQQGKLGRYGIGLISPLGKCHSFTFTSCPRGVDQGGYIEWTFVTDNVRRQADRVVVPHRIRRELAYRPKGDTKRTRTHQPIEWRTEVSVQKFTSDRVISRITSVDALIEGILERYGAVMRKNRVAISVKFVNEDGTEEIRPHVTAKQFTGRKLPEVVENDTDAGDVVFRLYLARKTTKGLQGKVIVGEVDNDFRFGWNLFARSANEWLADEVIQALSSGVFEGEILGTHVKLHANRKSFEKDDALVGFCATIEHWFLQHGKKHLKEVKEAREDQRYQELGLKSLRVIEELLRDPKLSGALDVIQSFGRGNIGEGHFEPGRDDMSGIQKDPAVSTGGGVGQGRDRSGSGSGGSGKGSPEKDKPGHHPFTVAGPKGQRRTLVKSDSLGLQFSHVGMGGDDRLWVLDTRHGVLHFNIRHPLWEACEHSDRMVMRLQEYIAIQALTLHTMPDEWQDQQRLILDDLVKPFVYLINNSDSYNLRRPKKAAGS